MNPCSQAVPGRKFPPLIKGDKGRLSRHGWRLRVSPFGKGGQKGDLILKSTLPPPFPKEGGIKAKELFQRENPA